MSMLSVAKESDGIKSLSNALEVVEISAGNAKKGIVGLWKAFTGSPIAMAVAAVAALVAALVAIEEANEAMNNAVSEYGSAKENVTSINAEIEEIKNRIDELNAKKGLSLVEKSELDNLKQVNVELERKKHLEDKILIAAAKNTARTSVEAYRKNFDNEISEDRTNTLLNMDLLPEDAVTFAVSDSFDTDLSARIAGIKLLKEEQKAVEKNTDTWLYYQECIDLAEESLWEQIRTLEEYKDNIEIVPFEELSNEQREALKEIQNSIDYVNSELDPDTYKQWKLDELFASGIYADAKDELVSITKKTKSLYTAQTSLYGNLSFLMKVVEQTGVSYEEFLGYIASDAGLINHKEVRKQLIDSVGGTYRGQADQRKLDFMSWIGTKSDDEVELLYKISLDGDTAAWKLEDWISALEYAKANYSTLDFSISTEIENVDKLKTALSESYSPTGLSSESISSIESIFGDTTGYDYDELFEHTAFGVQLNTEAFKELRKEYNKTAKSKLDDHLKELDAQIENCDLQLDEFKDDAEKTNEILSNKEGYENQMREAKELMSMYSALTSSFNDWLTARETANQNATFESMASGYAEAKELFKQGLVGTDDFISYVEMISGAEYKTAYDAAEAFENFDNKIIGTSHSLADMLNGGKQGTIAFLETLEDLNLAVKDGDDWSFNNLSIEDIASKLGTSVEFVIAMLDNLKAYGFEIDIDPTYDSLEELERKAKESSEKVEKELEGTDIQPLKVDLSVTGEEASNELDKIEEYVEKINSDSSISIDVKTDLLEDAFIKAKLLYKQANAPYVTSLDVSKVDASQQQAVLAIERYVDALAVANATRLTCSTDTSAIEAADKVVEEARKSMLNMPEARAILNLEDNATPGIEEVDSAISSLTSETGTIKFAVDAPKDIQATITAIEGEHPVTLNVTVPNLKEVNDLKEAIDGLKSPEPIDLSVTVPSVNDIKAINDLKSALKDIKSPEAIDATVKVPSDGDIQKIKDVKDALDGFKSPGHVEITMTVPAASDVAKIKDARETIDGLKSPEPIEISISVPGAEDVVKTQEAAAKIESKSATITVTQIGLEIVNRIKTAFEEIKNKFVFIALTIQSDAVELVIKLKTAIEGLKDKTVNVKAKTSGEKAVENLQASASSLNNKTVTITAFATGLPTWTAYKRIYDELKDKTVTITAEADGTGWSGGTAKVSGTAHAYGTAFSKGDWGTKSSGVALGGEVGTELVVRNGRWFTVGEDGAEFFHYKRDDIIFNAGQTAQIFKYGKIKNGKKRGDVFAQGSAFANGSAPIGGVAFANASGSGTIVGGGTSGGSSGGAGSSSGSDDSGSDTKEHLDWIEVAIDRIERAIEQLDSKASSTFKTWIERSKNLADEMSKLSDEIDIQQSGYDRYIQEANSIGLDESWAKLVRDGTIDIDTITDKDLKEKIKDYQTWYDKALDCKDAINDLNESLNECYQIAFDNIVSQFDSVLSEIENEVNIIDELIAQSEEKGLITGAEYYKKLIDIENNNIKQLEAERDLLTKAMNEAVSSGAIAEGSEAWSEMRSEIDDVTVSIYESNTELLKYANSMRDIQWEAFDFLRESVEGATSEVDFLIGLLSNKKLHDASGNLTDEGMATVGLYGINYNSYMREADEYAKEVIELDKALAENPYDQKILERRQELIASQHDMISAAEDAKQSIKNLVQEGIDLELSALQELISEYGEALDSAKDLYDYQKNISEKSSKVSDIRKQLLAYGGDTSSETRATVQKLKKELEDAESELSEAEYDRNIGEQKKLLDELYKEYEELLGQKMDDTDALISDMIDSSNKNADLIGQTIINASADVGYNIGNNLKTIFDGSISDANRMISVYTDNFEKQLTTVNAVLNSIKNYVASMADAGSDLANGTLGTMKQYKTGGLVDYTGFAKVDGTLEKPELILNANETENFLELRDYIRSLSDNSELMPSTYNSDVLGYIPHIGPMNMRDYYKNISSLPSGITSSVTYGDINIDIDHVDNYNDFIKKFRSDPKAEKIVKDMTIGQAMGKSSMAKFRHNLQ